MSDTRLSNDWPPKDRRSLRSDLRCRLHLPQIPHRVQYWQPTNTESNHQKLSNMAANQTAKPKELEIIPPSTAKSIENFCEGGWEAICMVKYVNAKPMIHLLRSGCRHLQSYMHLVSATLTSYTSAEVLARNMLHIEAHPDNYSFEIPTHARLWQAQMQTHLRTLKEIYHAIQPTRIAPRKLPTSSTCRTVASYRSLVDAADDLDRITGTGGILETAMEKVMPWPGIAYMSERQRGRCRCRYRAEFGGVE